jgi:hypothetical protein
MKALIFLGMMITIATNALAADCKTAATNAAAVETLQSDLYYHCGQTPATFDASKDSYAVSFNCVGETGSGTLSYLVSFSDDKTCSGPTVTDVSTN